MIFKKIGGVLLLFGALNWGLIGLFDFNLIAWVAGGAATMFARIVYVLFGAGLLFYLLGWLRSAQEPDADPDLE